MHIIVVYPYFKEGHGGLYSWMSEFTAMAHKLGHDITIVTSGESDAPEREDMQGIIIRRVRMRKSRWFRRVVHYSSFGRNARPVVDALLQDRPDSIVLSITLGGVGLAGLKYVHRVSSGSIMREFDMWKRLGVLPWWKLLGVRLDFWLQERLERSVIKNASALLTHTQALERDFKDQYKVSVPTHIPCCMVNTSTFTTTTATEKQEARAAVTKYGVPKLGQLLLFTATFQLSKGARTLEQALPSIFEKYPSATFVIVGAVDYQMNLGKYSQNVVQTGPVDRKKMPAFYRAADVFVYPTVANDAVPTNAMLEASASGLPIVICDLLGVKEAFKHNEDALVIPGYDSSALIDAVDLLLKDSSLRNKLGKNARKTAMKYSYATVTQAIIKFMKKLQDEGRV